MHKPQIQFSICAAGDASQDHFSIPARVHLREVPGTAVMAQRKDRIQYVYRELPRGGELRLVTGDSDAIRAIHEFMAFQRDDHRAGGMGHEGMDHGAVDHGEMDHGEMDHGEMDHTLHFEMMQRLREDPDALGPAVHDAQRRIEAVLPPDTRTEFRALMREHHEQMMRHMHGGAVDHSHRRRMHGTDP